jgi:hypothetical protein
MPTTKVFRENLPKILQNNEKFVKKDAACLVLALPWTAVS